MNGNTQPLDWDRVQRDPHAEFARHRANHWYAPFAGSDIIEVLSYEDVRELLAADDRLHEYLLGHLDDMVKANPNIAPELIAEMQRGNDVALINLEGEPHHRLRAAVSRAFTPRSVAALRPALHALAERLAAGLSSGDDFVASFAREMPALSLCLLTGIPEADHERFARWIDVLQVQLSPGDLLKLSREESEIVLAADRDLKAYTMALVQARRAEPRDDLLSRLAADEAGLDDATVARLIGDLIFAGNDTTRKTIAAMVLALIDQPETWERLAVDPGYAPAVVDEVLRLHGSAPGPVRRARKEFTHRGETIPDGAVAALSIWSANRDETFWGDDAQVFDPGREHLGQHLAFGHGPHFCLGASLAREELAASVVALSKRITNLRLLERPAMPPVGSIYGPLSLRVGFDLR